MNEELTLKEKQAIWAAGWLASQGNLIKHWDEWQRITPAGYITIYSDAELIAYTTDQGMVLPPELVGWTPIDQIPAMLYDAAAALNYVRDLVGENLAEFHDRLIAELRNAADNLPAPPQDRAAGGVTE